MKGYYIHFICHIEYFAENIIHCKSECVKLYKSAYIYLIHYICPGLFIFIMLHSVYVFILLK